MAKYSVRVVAVANVIATVEVEADSPDAARAVAVKYADGNATWQYDGLNDVLPIEAVEVAAI